MANRFWLSDFEISRGRVHIKKTGHVTPLDGSLLKSVSTWLSFYSFAQYWRVRRRLSGHPRPRIAFTPDQPRPWYFIWPVLQCAGAIIVKDSSEADIVFHFDDSTLTDAHEPPMKPGAVAVNYDCRDISKSRVAEAFERASGYGLAVDPRTHQGPMVEKAEMNGAHDGRIIEGPMEPLDGKTYQRLVDNEIEGGMVEDLRATIVGGEPIVVFRKRRGLDRRFLNENDEVLLSRPQNCYSPDELDVIRRFAADIGLDWGGVDVLRDRRSGKIFIVDANKTDMGPPIALPLGDKLKSTRWMARAFLSAFAP